MVDVDKVGPIASTVSPLSNWAIETGKTPRIVRKAMEKIADIHPKADLPKYVAKGDTFLSNKNQNFLFFNQSLLGKSSNSQDVPNPKGPSYGKRKVVIYSSCLVNYNKPDIGMGKLLFFYFYGIFFIFNQKFSN